MAGARRRTEASGNRTEAEHPVRAPTLDVLVAELRVVVRKGLPFTHLNAGQLLPNLRSVWARSVLSDDPASRVKALDALLAHLLTELQDDRLGDAARVLFAVDRHNRGTTLGRRRQAAADVAGYEVTHFRKRIEPRVIELVALALRSDALTYEPRSKKAARNPPGGEVSGDSPKLDAEDLTEQEELLSRLWSAVYGLRAELIAIGRLRDDTERGSELQYCKDSARWQTARVLTFVHLYIDRYGDRLMHGEAEFDAEGVIRLAGWTPEGLSEEERMRLRLTMARTGTESRDNFLGDPRHG